jgi:hypothetical protein
MRGLVSGCAAKSVIGGQNEIVRKILKLSLVTKNVIKSSSLSAGLEGPADRAGRFQDLLLPNRPNRGRHGLAIRSMKKRQ